MFAPLAARFEQAAADAPRRSADDGDAAAARPTDCVALALLHLVSSVPATVLEPVRASMRTLIISALRSPHHRLQGLSVCVLSLRLQEGAVALVTSADSALPIGTLVPLLVAIAARHAHARVRATALGCLLELLQLDYPLLHPHKPTVLKGLEAPLGDRRRAVRALAVHVRNCWAAISASRPRER